MWQLWPRPETGAGADASAAGNPDWRRTYLDFDRSAKQPWVMLNMVQSLNGAVTAKGLSEGLSSTADKEIFFLLRSLADFILVGASTVRLETYGPAKLSSELQAQRKFRGQSPWPTIAVPTASLSLEPSLRLFQESAEGNFPKPAILTVAATSSDPELAQRRADLEKVADVIEVPSSNALADDASAAARKPSIDLSQALQILAQHHATNRDDSGNLSNSSDLSNAANSAGCVILCEGGPSLNAALVGDSLIDEFCLSLSPHLVSGDSLNLLGGPARDSGSDELQRLELLSAITDQEMLFVRYGLSRGQ